MEKKRVMGAVLAGALLACGVMTNEASAAMVAYEDVGFIRGVGFESDSFTVEADGIYRATLTDFKFPEAFDELKFSLTTYNSEINSISGSGWFDFEAKSGTVYYANVFGVTGGQLDLGLYGIGVEALSTTPAAVPLPASLLLMSSALVVLGAFGRGGSKASEETMPAEALPA